MEVLTVLLFVAILILILSFKNNTRQQFESIHNELRNLQSAINSQQPAAPPVATPEIVPPSVKEAPPPIAPQPWKSKFEVIEEKSLSEELESLLKEAPQPTAGTPVAAAEQTTTPEIAIPPVAAIVTPEPPRKPSFMERNPDMEKFIGENLVSKIGIAILVLAIGFFVKYAIDNDWIGPVGRVGIGVLCGGILIAVAHRLRNDYKSFSSVLAGGGLAIFYFTISLAYHQFHLFSQTVSFVIMLVITAFAVVLSQLYNRQELAIIALIGGFATPFMVSNGSGNYKALFWYLGILNAGLLAIAYNKAWRLLNLLAFVFTVVLFAGWLFTLNGQTPAATFRNGLLFATIFYLLFFVINIAHNIKENKKFIASDFSILLANTALYFGAGIYLVTEMGAPEYKGLFTASLSVFNLACTYLLFRRQALDKNILYLLIGVTLSFVSLTAPIQLNGHNITLFWATEAVLLFWLSQKSKINIIRYGAYLVWSAMLVSLLMDWFKVYAIQSAHAAVITNKGFITGIFAAIASYLLFILKRNEALTEPAGKRILPLAEIFRVTALAVLFLTGLLEIHYQFTWYYPGTRLYVIYGQLFLFVFSLVFVGVSNRIKSLQTDWHIPASIYGLCVIVYLFNLPAPFDVQRDILENRLASSHFVAHWIGIALLAVIIYQLVILLRQHLPEKKIQIAFAWMLCTVCIILLSAEVQLIVDHLYYSNTRSLSDIQDVYVKAGLPIVWGLSSFGFMWLGMKHSFRPLRIISLSLFLLTLLKLFLFDIRNIPAGGKIAAFFCLGILLLIVSFMYQRLKKIIIADETTPAV